MKFLALALALFLAVGSQAASLPAEPPEYLAQARSIMNMYLIQVKAKALEAIAKIEDPEVKKHLEQRVELAHAQVVALQEKTGPITDGVVGTIMGVTSDFRANLNKDIEDLKTELTPLRSNLKQVLEKHILGYQREFGPVFAEYYAKHETEMEALREKYSAEAEKMQKMVADNLEETKVAVMPIVQAVRTKVMTWLDAGRQMASPYVQEYREQAMQAIERVKNLTSEDIDALRAKLGPQAQSISSNINSMVETISAAFAPVE